MLDVLKMNCTQGNVSLFSHSANGQDATWTQHTSASCGEPATSMAVHGDYLAVGTLSGKLFVWKGVHARSLQPANGFTSGPQSLDDWALTVRAGRKAARAAAFAWQACDACVRPDKALFYSIQARWRLAEIPSERQVSPV
jgi:hypothetical protein